MEAKYNDQGQAICPFCDSADPCQHWVCTMDITDEMWGCGNFWWNGLDGTPDWMEEIQQSFFNAVIHPNNPPPFHQSERLMKVWKASEIELKKNRDSDEIERQVYWPYRQVLYEYVTALLVEQGGIRSDYDIDHSPGFSSSYRSFHAKNPQSADNRAFRRMASELKGRYIPPLPPKKTGTGKKTRKKTA